MKKACTFLLIGIALLSMSACSCRTTGLGVEQDNEKQDLFSSITQTVPAAGTDIVSASPGLVERTQEETESSPSESAGPGFERPALSVSPVFTPPTTPTTPTSSALPTPAPTSGSAAEEPSNPSEMVDEQNDPFRYEGELLYFPDD